MSRKGKIDEIVGVHILAPRQPCRPHTGRSRPQSSAAAHSRRRYAGGLPNVLPLSRSHAEPAVSFFVCIYFRAECRPDSGYLALATFSSSPLVSFFSVPSLCVPSPSPASLFPSGMSHLTGTLQGRLQDRIASGAVGGWRLAFFLPFRFFFRRLFFRFCFRALSCQCSPPHPTLEAAAPACFEAGTAGPRNRWILRSVGSLAALCSQTHWRRASCLLAVCVAVSLANRSPWL